LDNSASKKLKPDEKEKKINRRKTIHKMKFEFSKIVTQEQHISKSMLPASGEMSRGNSDMSAAPWAKALSPIDAIHEVPEMVEVEENFNED
jgi:hypothetical protein